MIDPAEVVEAIVTLIVALVMLKVFVAIYGSLGYLDPKNSDLLFFLLAVITVGAILIGIAVSIID